MSGGRSGQRHFWLNGHDCPRTPDHNQVTLSMDEYNAALDGGDAMITIFASAEVDPLECDLPSYIRVRVEYPAERDCNENAVPDECDISEGISRDWNGNGIPGECECEGDIDADGVTGQFDLELLLTNWGRTGDSCLGDINGDTEVDQIDLGILLSDWGCGA